MSEKSPPGHLSAESKKWFAEVAANYALESHHLKLLEMAASAWDRSEQARRVIDAEGITILDRFDRPRAHPALAIERDSRIAFARLIRELDLEGEPLPDPRPRRR